MARRSQSTEDAVTYQDDAIYSVTLARPIKIGSRWINPGGGPLELKGKVVTENADNILTAERVA